MSPHAEALARMQALAEEQAALRRVATLVAANPEPAEIFTLVCAEIGTVLGVRSTNLTRFEDDGTQTVVAAWSIDSEPVFPVGGGVPVDSDAAVPKVRRSGHPERVDDYSGLQGELPTRLRAVGIASSVAGPITVEGRLWGAVVASSGTPYAFPPGTEDRVAGFAELVSDALANADAREQLAASRARLVAAADSERRRLERNLHDGAQQRLVGLAIALRQVESELDGDIEAARWVLRKAREELGQALEELRELARGIHPAVLSDRGLGPALESLATRMAVPVTVAALPARRLPEAVEAAAYFLVAEALTNVVKHAAASHATVEITRDEHGVRIAVCDDGEGGAAVGTGTGLRGLADRVEALGGRLTVESGPRDGTRVVGELPLD